MRWPRRGILIRLVIYVPVIAFLGWRAADGCNGDRAAERPTEPSLPAELAPHRRVITLPDGTQQEIVELTREEAEQILGHPIPEPAKAEAAAEASTKAAAEASTKATGAQGGSELAPDAGAAEPAAAPAN